MRISRQIIVGAVKIGGGAEVVVQSMTNTKTIDIESTIAQINTLSEVGCKIVRIALPNMESAKAVDKIRERVNVPLVADIHFDYRIAIEAAERGIDKIRINPGNIGDEDRVKQVVMICNEKKIPIRIGVNSGSVEREILAKHGAPTANALAESALFHANLLQKHDFNDIVLSIKSSDVSEMVKANRIVANSTDFPLHLGVTEAGTYRMGSIKSAVGIGSLLVDGIGATIRVSLTDSPIAEIPVAYDILKASGRLKRGVEIISCPTCARTEIDIITLASKVEEATAHIEKHIKIAVMGCVVNGPGEAKGADIGIAGGIAGGMGVGLIFKNGEIIKKTTENELFTELINEIDKM